jgi:polyribonucleotide nucleotidyltransferase
MAKQADGAVLISMGETVVMVTAVAGKEPRSGVDFMPLTCEYRPRAYAAGRIPGSFFRREGRPYEWEILVCRLMDRPARPLFPDGWRCETQLIAHPISFDKVNNPDVLAITGASAAVHISDIPFAGPLAAVRIGRVDGELIVNPTIEQREGAQIDIIVAATRDAVVMVEGECDEISEADLLEALMLGKEATIPLIDAQDRLREAVGKPKREFTPPQLVDGVVEAVEAIANEHGLTDALGTADKLERYAKLDAVKKRVVSALVGSADSPGDWADHEKDVKEAFGKVKKVQMRTPILKEGRRIGGRGLSDVRQIDCEVGVLPRTHGSALFTRGETQTLVVATLGTRRDEQKIDALEGDGWDHFMLHYNFEPFCVGEARFLRGSSRREIGHGELAKRAVRQILPSREDFPYTLRIVSEVLESNGSSSMASVCGASLALMDAGVKIKAPVAGVAMGLIAEGDDIAILTDILGDEDHLGDMDFKVCGTRAGITALQMDIKISGLSREVLERALEQARVGRLHILDEMDKTISESRSDLSQHAPRIVTLKIHPDKIRDIIGPGGKTIRGIVDQTGCSIDVEDDGTVNVASPDGEALGRAIEIIEGLTTMPELGKIYVGRVVKIADFGAFCQILPGTDGLLHISEIADFRINRVDDILTEGDEVTVKVIGIDGQSGKIKLSRREAMADLAKMTEDGKGNGAPETAKADDDDGVDDVGTADDDDVEASIDDAPAEA